MHRKISYFLFSLAILFLFTMNPSSYGTEEAMVDIQNEPVSYTLEELSQYNGKNEQPEYIAIDGVVYDVTHIAEWQDLLDTDVFSGQDISEMVEDESIRDSIIEKAHEVGILK
ncbi:hypothetical protein NSA47_12370 [Irregularibacter muris]|uniref:Cytochrome b5 heme-binding domain-containing protein n=1 Tax=Irregularibacter muris TaxID=1796619 RepID=A0AAE3HIH7_9FIRM|nr:cytochrome b5 domain-containing protein [Irregularibacter muris]MCR1899773.1 hypothetical protein [Irregularibacter muris]